METTSQKIDDLIAALDYAANFAEALKTAIGTQDKYLITMEYVEMLKQIANVDRLTKELAQDIES